MKFNIKKTNKPKNNFRIESVKGMFDFNENKIEEIFEGEIDIDWDWNIGIIVGNSGTGKSTIINDLFKNHINKYTWSNNCILDDFDKKLSIKEIIKVLMSVGFSSVPSFFKPFNVLSNGEKMRVELARNILDKNDIIIFDEYTSVVDRNIAKVMSLSINKYIKKNNKKFIAVGCHFDIIEWLQPDWIFNTNDFSFKKKKDGKDLLITSKYIIQKIKNTGTILKNTII